MRDQLIDAAAASRKVELGAVLGDFSRDRLKELCRALGHDDSGKEKAPIVARLVGVAPRPDADEDPEDPEQDDSLEAAPAEQTSGKRGKRSAKKVGGGDLGFEATLWQAADKLRNNMDAAEYKHVVLGLIFLCARYGRPCRLAVRNRRDSIATYRPRRRYGTIGNVYFIWDDFWPLNTALYVHDFKGTDIYYAFYLLTGLDFNKFSDKGGCDPDHAAARTSFRCVAA